MWSLFLVRKVGLPMCLPWPDDAMGRAEPHGHGVAAVQVSVFSHLSSPGLSCSWQQWHCTKSELRVESKAVGLVDHCVFCLLNGCSYRDQRWPKLKTIQHSSQS